ncbi:hypothetical protein BC827DRAFT_1157327 [Russula dissimulans]|nr:hypothetical protein BC827DRAFT_1157327 [Russula dissimulans]
MATVNTADLALPSPSPSQTPESSTSSLPPTTTSKPAAKSRPAPTSNEGAPPRKRSRSDMTPEQRKEARAHRNRIAAQNSRDKRKAQFSTLEGRISELEAENRALRAGMAYPPPVSIDSPEHRAADAAREAENRALRERVQALESAWEAIIRTLHVHGTTAGLPTILPPPTLQQSTHLPLSTGGERLLSGGVPAAGGPMQADEDFSVLFDVVADETMDEAAMDDLFHEILAAPPTPSSTAPILIGDEAEVPRQDQTSATTDADLSKEVEREMQRLFDLIPEGVSPLPADESGNTALELDLGAWEASIGLAQPVF